MNSKVELNELDWVQTSSGRLRLREDGIIHVIINRGHVQTPEDARENLRLSRRFCHTVKRRILLDIRGVRKLDKETRIVYADKDLTDFALAMALIVETDYVSQVMANFFLLFSRQPYPMKLFFEPEGGTEWLQKYKFH